MNFNLNSLRASISRVLTFAKMSPSPLNSPTKPKHVSSSPTKCVDVNSPSRNVLSMSSPTKSVSSSPSKSVMSPTKNFSSPAKNLTSPTKSVNLSPSKAALKRPASPKPKPPRDFLSISVDGNISSGKSTLVSTLLELLPSADNDIGPYVVETVPEPLDKWTNVGGYNLLDLLYKDTVANNFIFQHYVQLTRLADTVKPFNDGESEEAADEEGNKPLPEGYKGKVRIMERSIQNNRYCFSELARRQGTLHPAEFAVISEWYSWLQNMIELPLDLVLYLRTSPSVVHARMAHRGRTEEAGVPLDYLSALHETYEDWLVHKTIKEEVPEGQTQRPYEVIVIDADKSREEVLTQAKEEIAKFLTKKLQEKMEQDKENEEKRPKLTTETSTE